MIITCPHCRSDLDIADKQIGDRVHHARCNNWILVSRRDDGTRYGVKITPPVSYPKKRRR